MFDEISLKFWIRSGRKTQKRIWYFELVQLLLALAEYAHLRSPYSRLGRAECRVHFLFSTSRRPRVIAAVCWFLLRGCIFRPDDACQKRFSWFPDWIQKVQKRVMLRWSGFRCFRLDSKSAKVCKTHKCKCCRSRQELSNDFSVSLHVPFSQFLFKRDSYSNEYLLAKIGFDTASYPSGTFWSSVFE